MKINPVNFYNFPKISVSSVSQKAKSNPIDSIISFGNYDKDDKSFNAFHKWALDTDFLSTVNDLVDKTGIILGSGFEGTTYEIPDTDNWVLKEERRASFIPQPVESAQIFEVKDKAPSLNIGQCISYITVPFSKVSSRRFYILKKQKGSSYGVPYAMRTNVTASNINLHLNSLKNLSSYPQDSFNNMVREVITANDAGFKFDYYNPNNIMLDNKNKHIGFVDVEEGCINPLKNQLPDILYALLDGEFAVNFMKAPNHKTEKLLAQRYSNEIITKFRIAAQKCGAPVDKTINLALMKINL